MNSNNSVLFQQFKKFVSFAVAKEHLIAWLMGAALGAFLVVSATVITSLLASYFYVPPMVIIVGLTIVFMSGSVAYVQSVLEKYMETKKETR